MYQVFYGFIDEFNRLQYTKKLRRYCLSTAKKKADMHTHSAYVVKFGSNVPEYISEK